MAEHGNWCDRILVANLHVDRRIRLTLGRESDKITCYGKLVRALMEDQLQRVTDEFYQRWITERNGRESVRMAVQTIRLAGDSSQSKQIELVNA